MDLKCPKCGSEEIVLDLDNTIYWIENNTVEIDAECDGCDNKFTTSWSLAGFVK